GSEKAIVRLMQYFHCSPTYHYRLFDAAASIGGVFGGNCMLGLSTGSGA
ncbi:hypothetical protein SAMN05920897_1481, partial [Alkalispirochaeta americana]